MPCACACAYTVRNAAWASVIACYPPVTRLGHFGSYRSSTVAAPYLNRVCCLVFTLLSGRGAVPLRCASQWCVGSLATFISPLFHRCYTVVIGGNIAGGQAFGGSLQTLPSIASHSGSGSHSSVSHSGVSHLGSCVSHLGTCVSHERLLNGCSLAGALFFLLMNLPVCGSFFFLMVVNA